MVIAAKNSYFIKLGRAGNWADDCINNSTLRLGFVNPYHDKCLKGDWDFIREYWIEEGKSPSKATETTNQIRLFYESGEEVIWITFHNRKLYWCFSKKGISVLEDGTRVRLAIKSWNCEDIAGNELTVESISSILTKTQGFQGTICSVNAHDYLIRRINAQVIPKVRIAQKTYEDFKNSLIPLIKLLTWQDFELLIDLIFSYAGWKRIEVLGKIQKSIDLDLMSPVSGKRAFVQVKSSSDLNEFLDYVEQFRSMKQYDEMYFIVHSPKASLLNYDGENREKLITVDRIAYLSINSGLADWIIKKSK